MMRFTLLLRRMPAGTKRRRAAESHMRHLPSDRDIEAVSSDDDAPVFVPSMASYRDLEVEKLLKELEVPASVVATKAAADEG